MLGDDRDSTGSSTPSDIKHIKIGPSIGLDLPRVELQYFDGNPLEFHSFNQQFKYYIEDRISDPGQRYLYLCQYCRGRAREAILSCNVLPPDLSFDRAKTILNKRFGQAHIITRAWMDKLNKELRTINEEPDRLMRLSDSMGNMLLVFQSLSYESDLNASSTLEMIVRSLPLTMRQNWARVADELLEGGQRILFDDLQRFIESEARISTSQFGQIARAKTNSHGPRNVMALASTCIASKSIPCSHCSGNHSLDSCIHFSQLSIREKWNVAKRLRICFSCLGTGHRMSACSSIKQVNHECCDSKFHKVFHEHEQVTHSVNQHYRTTCRSSLGVLPVRVIGPKGEFETHALLDNGSEITLIQRDLVEQVGCNTSKVDLKVNSALGHSELRAGLTSIEVAPLNRSTSINVEKAYVVPKLTVNYLRIPNHHISRWPHLKDLNLSSLPDDQVKLLIGTDVPMAHWPLDRRLAGSNDPFAIQTPLGWVVLGPNQINRGESTCCNTTIQKDFEKLYNAEFCDASVEEPTLSVEDRKCDELVKGSSEYKDGHYYIALPWKRDPRKLPNNYDSAKQRLSQLRRKLIKDPVYKERYCMEINKLLQRGYASLVSIEKQLPGYSPKWYLPHHGVVNPKKPEKLRVVLDCAASWQGVSLNDFLYQGPDINNSLVSVLLRFRLEPFAVSADVTEMFMQIKVPESDRSTLRFLWWADEQNLDEVIELEMSSHPFGATSSPFCANYALRRAIKDWNISGSPTIAKAADNFYVDDLLVSFPTTSEAKEFVTGITRTLAKGGFILSKWISNHKSILSSLELASDHVRPISINNNQSQRMLGIEWQSLSDCFSFNFAVSTPTTRRGVLSAVSSIFDPLGLISPLVLTAKLLLQDLCRRGLDWDSELDPNDANVWLEWCKAMSGLKSFSVPRCIRVGSFAGEVPQIHVFSDASAKAYGVVVYAVFGSNEYCSLLFSKARVAPLKSITIPRLELAAATLSVRVASRISHAIGIDLASFKFWTDSMIVIYYLNNARSRYSVFVSNRVTVIRDLTHADQWRHITSERNPADLVSRGTSHVEEITDWIYGRAWIESSNDDNTPPPLPLDPPDGIEYKREKGCLNMSRVESDYVDKLSRLSSWSRILNSVAWMTRFTQYICVMHGKEKSAVLKLGPLTVKEIELAESKILQMIQRKYYPQVFSVTDVERGNINSSTSKRITNLKGLKLVLHEGLIRVAGRIYPYNQEHYPFVVPADPLTERVIEFYHRLHGHCGPNQLVSHLRERFWIVKVKSLVSRVLGRCWTCRRMNCVPVQQQMAPLAPYRFESGWFPFTHVGIDYFGPFQVKHNRSFEKHYVCLFSCLQIRAVHVELVNQLTTDSFILALTRFIARRGSPKVFYSDNGTNLVGAVRELKININGLDNKKINQHLMEHRVQWEFNPPNASHRGGLWERMIKSIRRILWAILADKNLTAEVLNTVLIQAEGVLNNRPIVHVSSDPNDFTFLTPNHLLLLRSSHSDIVPNQLNDTYRKRWQQVNSLTNQFWHCWVKEYVPTLQARQKWTREKRNLKQGDVVLLVGENKSRNQWELGLVNRVFPSIDGLVRTVELKTKQGCLTRDIRKVCLLEAAGEAGAPDNQ